MGRLAGMAGHSEQAGEFLTDGRFELRVPYRDSRQLVMDILHHGAEVAEALSRAVERYGR